MSAQFLSPCNLANQFGGDNDQQQQFNLLLQAIMLMKTRNETAELRPQTSTAHYLNTIFEPILKGHYALPIHLKILVERIVEHLDVAEVQKALKEVGWSLEDLKRGYVLTVS
jgi:hypothetical protein